MLRENLNADRPKGSGKYNTMDRAAHQYVVGPSSQMVTRKKGLVTIAADGCGTGTWWRYEKRQREA